MSNQELLPCPICGSSGWQPGLYDSPNRTSKHFDVVCRGYNGYCGLMNWALSLDIWQSIPRQSDALRGIVEEMKTFKSACPGGLAIQAVDRWANRISQIADGGECERCAKLDDAHAELWAERNGYKARAEIAEAEVDKIGGECERCENLDAELTLVRKAYHAMVSRAEAQEVLSGMMCVTIAEDNMPTAVYPGDASMIGKGVYVLVPVHGAQEKPSANDLLAEDVPCKKCGSAPAVYQPGMNGIGSGETLDCETCNPDSSWTKLTPREWIERNGAPEKQDDDCGIDDEWICSDCGARLSDGFDSSWRWAGDAWQHKCPGQDAQVGHNPCRRFAKDPDCDSCDKRIEYEKLHHHIGELEHRNGFSGHQLAKQDTICAKCGKGELDQGGWHCECVGQERRFLAQWINRNRLLRIQELESALDALQCERHDRDSVDVARAMELLGQHCIDAADSQPSDEPEGPSKCRSRHPGIDIQCEKETGHHGYCSSSGHVWLGTRGM